MSRSDESWFSTDTVFVFGFWFLVNLQGQSLVMVVARPFNTEGIPHSINILSRSASVCLGRTLLYQMYADVCHSDDS